MTTKKTTTEGIETMENTPLGGIMPVVVEDIEIEIINIHANLKKQLG